MATEQEKSVYMDLDVFGNENPDGSPKHYYDEDAIKNAFTSWIGSKKGDYIRRPEIGGIIDRLLFKTMDDRTAALMSFAIQNAILNEFVPELELKELSVNPDYQNRLWEIYIKYGNPLSNNTESIAIYTKDLSNRESIDYVSVTYTGNNLYNFCETKLPSMSGILVVYDDNREKWVWGQYELTNFSSTDSRYSDILTLVNG